MLSACRPQEKDTLLICNYPCPIGQGFGLRLLGDCCPYAYMGFVDAPCFPSVLRIPMVGGIGVPNDGVGERARSLSALQNRSRVVATQRRVSDGTLVRSLPPERETRLPALDSLASVLHARYALMVSLVSDIHCNLLVAFWLALIIAY